MDLHNRGKCSLNTTCNVAKLALLPLSALTGSSFDSSGELEMYRKVAQSGARTDAAPAQIVKTGFINALSGRPFSAVDGATLRDFAASRGLVANSAVNQFLVSTKGLRLTKDAKAVEMPLPKYCFDGSLLPSDACARKFYLSSDVECTSLAATAIATAEAPLAAPRCGLTGKFFLREEVVDNLMMAALEMKFSSPFWIRDTHPQLGKFLELRAGSSAIQIAITAAVVPLEKASSFPMNVLHSSVVGRTAPKGTNALTGKTPANPWFKEKGPAIWVTLDQMARYNVSFASPKDTAQSASTLVEVDQLVLYNAEQLVVPGRLALNRSLKGAGQNDDITKIFE